MSELTALREFNDLSIVMSKQVTLLLPGYAVTFGDENAAPAHPCHASFRFVHDSVRQPWQSQLADAFGVDTCGGRRLPSAKLGCGDDAADLVRADPVSLTADRDTAKLMPAQALALSDAEADELLLALNDFVVDDGLAFFRHSTGQWYMSGMTADALESYPPSFLADRNASAFLPDGDAAAPWRRLLTEIQMLLHMQPVNQQREQRGLLPVNSVWFWGGAPLPVVDSVNADVILFADDAEALALARHMGVVCEPLSGLFAGNENLPLVEHIIIMDDSLVSAWLQADAQKLEQILSRINEQWLQPLMHQVEQGQLLQVQLLTEDGLYGVCDAQSLNVTTANKADSWLNRLWSRFSR